MAERTNYKNPPILSDENEYGVWSNEISMWQLVTDLDQRKQALAVTLFLNGTAREAALEIKAEELNTIDGMKILLTKLDSVLQKDRLLRRLAYEAYTVFERCKRHESTSITDHIVEFERKYNQIKKH